MQEPQSFGHHFIGKEINASGVAARPGEVDDKTKLNRVFTDTEDDRDACCRSFGCKRGCCANRGDHGHLSADQVGHQCRQAIVLGLQPVVLDRHVLAFDVAGFVEAFAKRGRIARVGLGRPVSDKPNHWHRRLLRARRKRPRSRSTEQRDELAPPHYSITSSAISRKSRVIVKPSALAAFRLMTSSNLVGCCTGNSAGLAPLRTLSRYGAVCRPRSARLAP